MRHPDIIKDVVFRKTRQDEIEALFSIRARTRENALSKEQLASLGITPESIACAVAAGQIISVSCQHGADLVGFCNADTRTGELLVLAVLPSFEGCGIGRQLLAAAVAQLRASGHRELWLVASPDPRVRAHGFYRAQGWRPSGKNPEGCEILTLSLPAPGV